MLRRVLLLAVLILLVSLPVTVSVAKTPEVKLLTTMRDNIDQVFWLSGDQKIGIFTGKRISVISSAGKKLWNYEQPNRMVLTKGLVAYTEDEGLIMRFAPEDGRVLWKNKLPKDYQLIEGIDDWFLLYNIDFSIDLTEFKVYNNDLKELWSYKGSNFYPGAVLPGGNVVVGTYYTNENISVLTINNSKKRSLIAKVVDPYFVEGGGVIKAVTNKVTKRTLIKLETAKWWAVLAENGEVILNQYNLPIKKNVHSVVPCGEGFAFVGYNDQVITVTEKGKVLWSVQLDKDIKYVSANADYLAILCGESGGFGIGKQLMLFNKNGKLLHQVRLVRPFENIQIAKSAPKVLGVYGSELYLVDFGDLK